MPLFRMTADQLAPVATTSFSTERIRERQDLQRLLRHQLEVLGDDLLFVAEEYAAFQDSRRRIDLLALDRSGRLVVIELKRTDDGGHMELQALRYAAMVSTMTFEQLVATYAEHNEVTESQARQALGDWLLPDDGGEQDELAETLADQVRVVLVAADFSTEVTSTVLWLNEQYGLDIECFRLVPYRLGPDVLIDVHQLIPLAEAADFQIKQRDKNVETAAAKVRASAKDYTRYDVAIGENRVAGLSKQAAVLRVVRELLAHGVPGSAIRAELRPRRWHPVARLDGESLQDAFHRQHPDRGTHYWFDLGMDDAEGEWVMPRLGGTKTELYLDALVAVGVGRVEVSWERAHD